MRRNLIKYCWLSSIMILLLALSGCYRGRPSENPPVHLNPNMDNQEKYKAQAESEFFADGSAMRTPVEGTVPRNYLRENIEYYQGKNKRGEFIKNNPIDINMSSLERGRERFDIYCSPCHSRLGDGRGIMISKGYLPPPSFHVDRIREMPDGQIYDIIANGIRNMPSYRHQIMPDDRWAIVAYLRALQRSQNATEDDLPAEMKGKSK